MRRILPAVLVFGLLVAACSDDGDETSSTTVPDETTTSVEEVSDTTLPPPDPEPEDPTGTGLVCVPAGEPVAVATGVLDVTAREWALDIIETEVKGSDVFVSFTNGGDAIHELKIVKADSIDDLPTEADGSVDESKIEPLEPLGPIGSGDSCEGTYKLDAGTYVAYSDLINDDGDAYFELGAATVFTVIDG